MENHLTNKNTKKITFQSQVDPINYRVITNLVFNLCIINLPEGVRELFSTLFYLIHPNLISKLVYGLSG
jgi:hypothetical protein